MGPSESSCFIPHPRVAEITKWVRSKTKSKTCTNVIALLQACKPQSVKGGKDTRKLRRKAAAELDPSQQRVQWSRSGGPQPGRKRGLVFFLLREWGGVPSWASRPPPYYSHLSHGCLRQNSGKLGPCDFSRPGIVKDMTSSALSALSLLIAGAVNPPAPPCGNQVALLRNRGFPIGEMSREPHMGPVASPG